MHGTTTSVLLPGAGTGAANNLIRSLRADYPGLVVVGTHIDRFTLRNSKANRNYLLPAPGHPGLLDCLRKIIERDRIDLLMPNTDADVRLASERRDVLPCRVFLPSKSVIERCQDRYDVSQLLRTHGVPVATTHPVTGLDSLEAIFARLAPGQRIWCRVRSGSESGAAAPVDTPDDARAWIAYWERMRGVPATRFTLSEYLPGRDFACQSLWKNGRLVLVKTVERLADLGAGARISGTSSITSLAKTVSEPRVVDTCVRAIRALDPHASGAFSVKLKENRSGRPCVTEVNAGRFTTMLSFFDFTGTHNMSATYVRLALDEPVDIADPYDVSEDRYFVRGVDMLPAIYSAEELVEGIEESNERPRHRSAREAAPGTCDSSWRATLRPSLSA
jgi:carbamoyl-phosphate synthase large subunit